jgi:prepilin-type N-terminal cleavage/methylation domain
MRSLQNTKGFTLVEILVGVGLVGIVLFAIFGLQSGLLKSQNSSMNSMEVTDLRYEVSGILSNDARCSAALVGKTSGEGLEIDIAPNIKAGAKYGKLLLSVVRLSEVRDLGNNKRTANVQLIGTKTGANALSNTFNELVPVYYWVNSAGTIVTCKDNSSVCTSLGGIWKADHCDFCANLGGTLQADNTCRTN